MGKFDPASQRRIVSDDGKCLPGRRRQLPFSPWHLLLLPTALVFLLPLLQMVLTSLMSDSEINRFPPRFLPTRLSFGGYTGLFTDSPVLRWVLNTVLVSTVGVLSHCNRPLIAMLVALSVDCGVSVTCVIFFAFRSTVTVTTTRCPSRSAGRRTVGRRS